VTVDGIRYGAMEATLDRVQGSNLWLTISLREGKNREVKRVLAHLGLSINRLIRISYGPFQLGELAVGAVREVSGKVLRDQLGAKLAAAAKVDFTAPVRLASRPVPAPERRAKRASAAQSRAELTKSTGGRGSHADRRR
jgi:23S rRNA pseudouridine2605 synthase